jgi:hypothetical protein
VLAVNRPEQLPQPGHAACSMMLSSVLSIFPASKRPAASKTVETLINGRKAQYVEPLKTGDVLDIFWKD